MVQRRLVCLDPPKKLHRCSCGRSFLRHSGHWDTVQTVARCQGDDKAPNSSLPLAERSTGMTLVFCAYHFPCFPDSEMQNIAHSLSFFFKHGISAFFFLLKPTFLLPLPSSPDGGRNRQWGRLRAHQSLCQCWNGDQSWGERTCPSRSTI